VESGYPRVLTYFCSMIRVSNPFKLALVLFPFCFTISGCFKDLPDKTVVYKNDFETGNRSKIKIFGPQGFTDSLKITSFYNSKVFGRFNSEYVIINLDTLPEHNAIKIEFDLYLHDQWEGNRKITGAIFPDLWQLTIDKNVVLSTTFSNGNYPQSYPDNYQTNPIDNAALGNSWGVLPGACLFNNRSNGTSHYKFEYTTTHKGDIELILNDLPKPNANQCTKSWSIDNLQVTAINYK